MSIISEGYEGSLVRLRWLMVSVGLICWTWGLLMMIPELSLRPMDRLQAWGIPIADTPQYAAASRIAPIIGVAPLFFLVGHFCCLLYPGSRFGRVQNVVAGLILLMMVILLWIIPATFLQLFVSVERTLCVPATLLYQFWFLWFLVDLVNVSCDRTLLFRLTILMGICLLTVAVTFGMCAWETYESIRNSTVIVRPFGPRYVNSFPSETSLALISSLLLLCVLMELIVLLTAVGTIRRTVSLMS